MHVVGGVLVYIHVYILKVPVAEEVKVGSIKVKLNNCVDNIQEIMQMTVCGLSNSQYVFECSRF